SIDIASIACGHARELDHLPSEALPRIRFWGIDQDEQTVTTIRERFRSEKYRFEISGIRALLLGRMRIPVSDFIYAAGLFDYLDQRSASLLLKRMIASLGPGGIALIANLTPANDEIGYMEAIMDWWMQYRDESSMEELAAAAGLAPNCRKSIFKSSNDK